MNWLIKKTDICSELFKKKISFRRPSEMLKAVMQLTQRKIKSY